MDKVPLDQSLKEWSELLPRLAGMAVALDRAGAMMLECFNGGRKALIAGNGGSAADAMHFTEELVVRFRRERKALAAIALCDPTIITCGGNDYGYDTIFARQVEALGQAGDVLITLSTSGNSANLVRAIAIAKARGMKTIAFLGKDGGKARGMCDVELIVPSQSTARIQEAHKLFFHTLCEYVDERV